MTSKYPGERNRLAPMALRAAMFALGACLPLAVPAFAQAPAGAPIRILGTVETLAGDTLLLKSSDRRDIAIALPADTRITALANRQLSDIKPGDFVGSAAIKGTDGRLHAQEVHIFPEAMRGSGEGNRAMARPDQSMTNATVSVVAAAPEGRVLTLDYEGGTREIEVGPDVRIVTFIPGDRGLLKHGATVVVSAVRAPDGAITARSVQAEKDGVMPLIF